MPKVLRLSEQYLIRAEAYVQQAQPDYGRAGKDITALRTARYSTYGGSTSLTASNAMDVIEAERVKELYMEGFRLHDLKRWHKGFERKPQDQSLANGSSLKLTILCSCGLYRSTNWTLRVRKSNPMKVINKIKSIR